MCSHSHCPQCGSVRPTHSPKCAAVVPPTPRGWQCPNCLKVHAPFVVACSCTAEDYSWAKPHIKTDGTAQ